MNLLSDNAKAYFACWKTLLSRLLGWTDAQILEWAGQFETDLNDENSLLYREPAEHYVSYWLVPKNVAAELDGHARMCLASRLEAAIRGDNYQLAYNKEYDWVAIKARVNGELVKYGENLDSVRDERKESIRLWWQS